MCLLVIATLPKTMVPWHLGPVSISSLCKLPVERMDLETCFPVISVQFFMALGGVRVGVSHDSHQGVPSCLAIAWLLLSSTVSFSVSFVRSTRLALREWAC